LGRILSPSPGGRRVHGVRPGAAVHQLPARRAQEQPRVGGLPADAPARDESDGRAPSGRRHPRQPDVHALRPGARRAAVREGGPAAARARALHRPVRHQARRGAHAPARRRVARQLLWLAECAGLARVPQGHAPGQYSTEFAGHFFLNCFKS